MKLSTYLATVALSVGVGLGLAIPEPQITDSPSYVGLEKRQQTVLTNNVWTSVSSKIVMAVTPTIIDGVTISASPVSASATPWVSLDQSGIPYAVTPTTKDGEVVSTSPVPTASNFPSPSAVPPVLRCFGSRVPDVDSKSYPFCSGVNGTEMVVGQTYWITWDPTYFCGDVEGCTITRVKIDLVAYPQTGSNDYLFESNYLSNADGYYPLYIEPSFVRESSGYFYITITPLTTSKTKAAHVGTKGSTLIRAIKYASDAQFSKITRVPSDNGSGGSSSSSKSSSGKSNKAGTIAPAVVVPVVVVIVVAAAVIWYLSKQKKSISSLVHLGRSANGGGLGSKSQRMGTHDPNNKSNGLGSTHVELSPATTNADLHTVDTATTANTQNPFKDSSRAVL